MSVAQTLSSHEQRIQSLEDSYNNLVNAILKMVTLEQAEQLGLLGQDGVEELESRMDGVEARVSTLELYHRSG